MPLVNDHVTVERLIPASPEKIFELLADPGRHPEIDGSGTVQQARSGGRRLALGDSFGMEMKWGVAYKTRNTIVEFEENKLIAWQTLAPGPLGKLVTGRVWRYELVPTDDGTLVRETWDISQERFGSKRAIRRFATLTEGNMTRTLERIEQLVTSS
jgi:uncharacterized protein YndB with AHSA1/START domain